MIYKYTVMLRRGAVERPFGHYQTLDDMPPNARIMVTTLLAGRAHATQYHNEINGYGQIFRYEHPSEYFNVYLDADCYDRMLSGEVSDVDA